MTLVQTLWQGLSARAELGAGRDELAGVARLSLTLITAGAPGTCAPTAGSVGAGPASGV
jgi:hypothetical protein